MSESGFGPVDEGIVDCPEIPGVVNEDWWICGVDPSKAVGWTLLILYADIVLYITFLPLRMYVVLPGLLITLAAVRFQCFTVYARLRIEI